MATRTPEHGAPQAEQPATGATAPSGYRITQIPRFQHTLGTFEAVARLSSGEKIIASADNEERTWAALEEQLRKQGIKGEPDTAFDEGNASSDHIAGGQAFNAYRAAQTAAREAPKKGSEG